MKTREMLRICDQMIINYDIFTTYYEPTKREHSNQFKWTVTQTFDLEHAGLVVLKLGIKHKLLHDIKGESFVEHCDHIKTSFQKFIFLGILSCSVVNLLLNLHH